MAYLAFYRTFRPTTFDEVVRQEHIVRTLKNQIISDKVGHAYLFCGPRGTGKTTLAKIFARAINCESPVNGSPCGKCAACRALAEGGNLDIYEIDAASNNGVDEMRDLREKVQYPPVAGRYKVYIIDEVHMLTQSAFNAVLKTLEEPPRHAVFILATTEPQKIPATILSRCMRFDFKLIPQKDLEELIKSVFIKTGKQFEDEAVAAIARAGAGSARDCLSIADMCASYSREKLTYSDVNAVLGSADQAKIADLCEYILTENASGALETAEQILSTGKSVGVLIKDMLSFMNNCTIVKVCRDAKEIVNLPEETFNRIHGIAENADPHKILRVTEILTKCETDMRYAINARITLETAILKGAMPAADYDIDAILGRISLLEKQIAKGGISITAAPSVPSQNKAANTFTEKPKHETQKHDEESHIPLASVLEEDTSLGNPFEHTAEKNKVTKAEPVQSYIGENVSALGSVTESQKSTVFAKFIKCLRTTHKNAVLFTLCMDLEHAFEGDNLILYTDSDPVLKALGRPDNAKFIAGVLEELGVLNYEIRKKAKGESDYEKALKELKQNFSGTDIEIE